MPQQPVMKLRKLYNTMPFDSKPLKKIDYAGDFDKEFAKFEKIAVPKAKGMDKTGYGPKIYDVRPKSSRRQQARDMMRTSLPTEPRYREDVDPDGSDIEDMKAGRIKPRETKQDMIRRKKKELGIVGQLTESELKTMKRSMSENERKMLGSK